jgi:hypothetical protein
VHNRGSTTPNVIAFVSDIERSVRWYRDNVGLAEASEPDIAERHDSQVTVMARNRAGVALVSFGRTSRFSRDVQMVCFVLEGPPAPPSGSGHSSLSIPTGHQLSFRRLAKIDIDAECVLKRDRAVSRKHLHDPSDVSRSVTRD